MKHICKCIPDFCIYIVYLYFIFTSLKAQLDDCVSIVQRIINSTRVLVDEDEVATYLYLRGRADFVHLFFRYCDAITVTFEQSI